VARGKASGGVVTIHPEVLARWAAFSEPLEGRIPWLYLDVKGLATVGVGCLIDNPIVSQSLPWSRADGDLATAIEIVADWKRVLSIGQTTGTSPRRTANHYYSPHGLHLTDAAIDALMRKRLQANARVLALRFPAFPDWPWQAQMGALSLCWAVGTGTTRPGLLSPEWPKLQAALRARDWATCARECGISTVRNAGVAARNEANRRLFEEAARA
jgi:GH24 family phage-related lysozyme (muramidase)